MPGTRTDFPHRYSVVVIGDGHPHATRWTWEIMRTPELGVRLYGMNFISAEAAKRDGDKALQNILKSLPDEELNA